MGDRTSIQVFVYDCPQKERRAARKVLAEDYDLEMEWGAGTRTNKLNLTAAYTAHEISCGSAQEIATALHEAAPGASFVLWEDPKYDWLGDVYAHTPALGMFSAECDANGQPVYTSGQVAKMIREAGIGRHADDLIAALGKAMGEPWFEDWRAHVKPEPDDIACSEADN